MDAMHHPPTTTAGDDGPAQPLSRGQRRGSVELAGSGRDWASMRARFMTSQIMKAILDYRKGRTTRKDLEAAVEGHRADLFLDHPEDGNILHELIRRGFTRTLLQVILPAHPDAVLALEQNKATGEHVTLLRRALQRQDRELIDGIFTATGYLVRRSVELGPVAREAIFETALRLEEWGAALRQFPSLLENSMVRRVFSLQRSPHSVISDDADHASHASHRVDLAYDEVRVRGSETAFPSGFWTNAPKKPDRLTIFGWAGLLTVFNLAGTQSQKEPGDGAPSLAPGASSAIHSSDPPTPSRQISYDIPPSSPPPMQQESTLMFQDITETSGVEVQPVLLPFPFMLRAGEDSLLGLLCELYERTGKSWLFELEIVPLILDFKWKSFGRKIYKALLFISCLLAVNYSLAVVYMNSIIASEAPYAFGLSVVWRVLVVLNSLPIVLQEAWQCRTQGFGPYIKDVWNALDVLMLSLLYASLGVSFVLPSAHRYYYLLSAFACLLIWFKLLNYLRGFRHTGPLVSIMSQIIIDMRFFLFVLGISVLGFGFCLYLLFQVDIQENPHVDEEIKSQYGSVFDAILILFGALNGNWDYNALSAAKFSGLSTFIFVLFCVSNTIILLNLLIALMADSFDRVQENALAQGRYEQALSIQQIEAMLAPSILRDPRFFPRYLQILRPKSLSRLAAGDDRRYTREWTGRLQRMYKKIEQSERRLGREVGLVLEKLNHLEARLAAEEVELQEHDGARLFEGIEGEMKEGDAAASASGLAGPLSLLHQRLMPTLRSSYYDEDELGGGGWDETASVHSDTSTSAGGGGFASNDSVRFTSGLQIPRIAPPVVHPPAAPLLARAATSTASGRSRRSSGAGVKGSGEGRDAAAVREMGERLTRLEGKLDALLQLLPAAQPVASSERATAL